MCCSLPSKKVIKCGTISFVALGGLHEDKLCDTLQAMTPTNNQCRNGSSKPLYSISRATPIDSDYCRLPTASVLSIEADKSSCFEFLPSIAVCFVCISPMVDGPERARLSILPTEATLPSRLQSLRIFPSLPGSRLRIFIALYVV